MGGLLIGLFDDRNIVVPLVEFKMPTFMVSGNVDTINDCGFTKLNIVVTA